MIQVDKKDDLKAFSILLDNLKGFSGFRGYRYAFIENEEEILKELDAKKVRYKVL